MAEYEAFRDMQTPEGLQPCDSCGRTFNPDVLAKHSRICVKQKKRKMFDSSRQRLDGIEIKPNTKSSSSKIQKPKQDWRQKHNELISTIRSARDVTAAVKAGAPLPPPPPPTVNPDYVQCPYCNRRFNESAAERHMGFCKEKNARLAASNSKAAQAKDKLSKRTQYKPPLPGVRKTSSSGQTPQRNQAPTAPMKRTPSDSPKVRRRTTEETMNYGSSEGLSTHKTKPSPPLQRRTMVLKKESDAEDGGSYSRGQSLRGHDRAAHQRGAADSNKQEGRKGSGRDPQWFEDLKKVRSPTPTEGYSGRSATEYERSETGSGRSRRHGSGSHSERSDKESYFDLNEVSKQRRAPARSDSGIDFDENSARSKGRAAVGVVRPSSRQDSSKYNGDFEERTPSGRTRLANFCHECGTKYPVPKAKFCCECGTKRMHIEL